jgi:16S rRNA (cytosine967-C5)-methyltransferase
VKAGIDTIETRCISSSKIYKRLEGTADRLLLDAPCSGLGTLRRNPDIKWKLTSDDLNRLIALQQDLLEGYAPITRPCGRMVYSVCSILPSECEVQIARFLRTHSNTFRLISEQRCSPETDGTDGFYMALLERVS